MFVNYSVLMSVYAKENPEYLRMAMQSISQQTVSTNDFVVVCDGELTVELDSVILEFKQQFGEVMQILRLEKNVGLGNALKLGLQKCKNELVARMDSDDISLPNRMELEMDLFNNNSHLSIVGSVVAEFTEDQSIVTGQRRVPENQNDIILFSKNRNPFNHPSVMFKKSDVEKVGNYDNRFPFFEDYNLWIRLLHSQYNGSNIQEPLVLMRVSEDMYLRRGGFGYAKNLLAFHLWLKKIHWIGLQEIIFSVLPHAIVCILPNIIRSFIYKKLRT